MELNFRPPGEETKVPGGEQSASAGRHRTPVRLRPGAPSRTAVLLSPRTPSRTRLSQSEAPSKAPVLPKDAPSKAPVLPKDAPSRTRVLPKDAPSRTRVLPKDAPSKASVLPKDAPSKASVLPKDAPSRTRVLPKDAPSRTRVPLSESSSKTPVFPNEVPSQTLSAESSQTPGTPGSLSAASSRTRTPAPPSEEASSPTLVSLSEASSRIPGPPSEAPSGIQMPPKTLSSSPQVNWDPRGFWAVDAGAEHPSQEPGLPGPSEDARTPAVSYFGLIRNYLKSERPTKAVQGLIEVTVEVMKLDHQVKETEIQQKVVRKETEMLLNEKLPIQAETKVMLANLNYKTKEYRREIENQWNNYAQESGETQRPGQESGPRHTEQTPEPHTAQLSEQQRKLAPLLKQQLEAAREMSKIRENQYKELQALQEELKKARAQTAAKAHARYLREKALLEKQLSESAPSELGENKEKELKTKAQALEAAAERCAAELHRLLAEGRSLPSDFTQPYSSQGLEEKTPQSWLKIQKQQLK